LLLLMLTAVVAGIRYANRPEKRRWDRILKHFAVQSTGTRRTAFTELDYRLTCSLVIIVF